MGSRQGRCGADVGSMWSWMENIYNKIIKLRENIKIVQEEIKKLRRET